MTATQTAPFGFAHNFVAFLRRLGGLVVKAVLALAIIFAAGIIAVGAATVGLALACVALLMRLFSAQRDPVHLGPQRPPTSPPEGPNASGDQLPITLEARKTARGWTVE